jgi:hypothetical protein
MRRRLPNSLLATFLILLVSARSFAALASPFDHQAYIWQRVWTDQLATTTQAMAADFSGYRVLIAEADVETLRAFSIHWAALAAARRPVTLVLRIPGAQPQFSVTALLAEIDTARKQAQAAGVDVRGVEIDHDCARSRLPAYAKQLRVLRSALPPDLALSITALPDWLRSDDLEAVLAAVDASVLQLHAVSAPAAGLFDPALALRWTRAYARRVPHPFRVALPAYSTRVSQDADGRIVAIESDAATMPVFDEDARELVADPRRVAVVLRRLRETRPASLSGVAWFRLPLASDRRAWSATTLQALMADTDVSLRVVAERVRIGQGANFDIVLRNRQRVDLLAPRTVNVPSDCRSGDGVAGYRFDAGQTRFDSDTPPLLKPGTSRTIGWVHCPGSDAP